MSGSAHPGGVCLARRTAVARRRAARRAAATAALGGLLGCAALAWPGCGAAPGASAPDDRGVAELGRGDQDAQAGVDAAGAADSLVGDTPADDGAVPEDPPAPLEPIDDCATRCADVVPRATPEANRTRIQSCVRQCPVTTLRGNEVFLLKKSITVPSGATLTTAGGHAAGGWAELRETGDPLLFGSNKLVTLCSKTGAPGCDTGKADVGGTIRFLVLNVDNKNNATSPNMVINIDGAGNLAEHVEVMNPNVRTTIPGCGATYGPARRVSGISFNPPDHDNVIRHSKIHGVTLGVVFNENLKPGSNNLVADVEIFMNRSNPVTFAGFGKVINSHIHHNGWCIGDGMDGGAVYCQQNHNGGVLEGNEIHDTCRDVIDYDRCWNMTIRSNHLYNPGTRVFPAPVGNVGTKCNSSQTMRLGAAHGDTIVDNVVENRGRPWNTVANHFRNDDRFSATGAAPYSDLPSGSRQSLAFLLVRRRDQLSLTTEGNNIRGNTFIADCNASGCVGMGFFTTRGTGVGIAGGWSGTTANTFRENDEHLSTIGSRRCGANWYAGSTASCAPGSTADECNSDDASHQGTKHGVVHSTYRNCGCRNY